MKSQLPSLKVRRLRAIALEAFKILNNLSPVYLNDLLTFKNLSYSFRYTQTVEIYYDGPKMIFSLCNFGVKLHNLVFCKYAFLSNTRMHN